MRISLSPYICVTPPNLLFFMFTQTELNLNYFLTGSAVRPLPMVVHFICYQFELNLTYVSTLSKNDS